MSIVNFEQVNADYHVFNSAVQFNFSTLFNSLVPRINKPSYTFKTLQKKKKKFSIKGFFSKCNQIRSLVTFTEEILNRKLHFSCSKINGFFVKSAEKFSIIFVEIFVDNNLRTTHLWNLSHIFQDRLITILWFACYVAK